MHRKALPILEQGAREHPDQALYRTSVGNCLGNIGGVAMQRGAYEDALRWLDRAIQTLESILRITPNHAYTRSSSPARTSGGPRRTTGWATLGRRWRIWDGQRSWTRGIRATRSGRSCALVLAQMGDRAGALAEVAGVEEQSDDGGALYTAAALHALLAAQPADDAEDHADRAMSLLARARATGLLELPANLEEFSRDRDLDPLRPRPDFRAFAADLAFPANPFGP